MRINSPCKEKLPRRGRHPATLLVGAAACIGAALVPIAFVAAQEQLSPKPIPAVANTQPTPAVANAQPSPSPSPSPGESVKPATTAPVVVSVAAAKVSLGGTDVETAIASATLLGQSREPGALDALLDALAMGLHPRIAAAALAAVGLHRDPASLDTLLHYARNRNPDVRAQAIIALGQFDDQAAVRTWRSAFGDSSEQVRAAAAHVASARKDANAGTAMIALLERGDRAMATALAAVANADIARRVAELIGTAPPGSLADCLGGMLLRADLGSENVYVEVVRALGKINADEALVALTTFVSMTPENPPRQSRREAQVLCEQRLGGGGR
ncbi:MAG: HEAT repeat domain-containing protein [Pseudomonadota bacterium]